MEYLDTGSRWMRPLAVVLAIIVIAWAMRSPTRAVVSVAPPEALGAPAPVALQGRFEAQVQPTVAVSVPAPLAGAEAVISAGNLSLYTTPGSYSADQVREIQPSLDEALRYVSDRTAMQLSGPVSIVFSRRDACGLDGAAYTDTRTIMLYACPDIPQRRAINILAHEFVHQLANDRYGAAHMQADLALSEGLATWGAGKYWLGNATDFRGFVKQNYAANLLPLGSHYRDYGTIDAMNRLYYQWASLVDFIITTHGRDSFDRLYASGHGMQPNTADYQGVLGEDLAALETEWRAWIDRP